MSRGIPMGRGPIAMLGALLVFVLVPGALAGCGGSSAGGGNATPPPVEEANSVVVRVSGTEGTAYEGDYGSLVDSQPVNGTVGSDPTEYEIQDNLADGITAFFRKTEPGEGELKAEIVADGTTATESTAYAELGSVLVEYLPESGPFGEDQYEESP